MRVEVARVTTAGALREELQLPEGTTVGEALAASRLAAEDASAADGGYRAVAVHGAVVATARTLEDGERIDLLPALPSSPTQARQRRARDAHQA